MLSVLAQTQIPWEQAAKVWGPLGVIFLLVIVGVIYGAKWHKSFVESTMADLRTDRDKSRQLNEKLADDFLTALRQQAATFEKGFDEVIQELHSQPPRRR
jgi:Tfp pilus assembly protein PilO